MAKVIEISPVEQHIIDQVRQIREALNMTAEALSKLVSPSGSGGLIGNIESSARPETYTDHNLNIIAKIFTRRANELNVDHKKDYTVHDFYPRAALDDTPVNKRYLKPDRPAGPTKSLYRLTNETNFFDQLRTLKEITTRLNEEQNEERKTSNYTSAINLLRKNNILERIYLKEGTVAYRKAKKD
ncbi:hypothetical protein SAMN06265348_104122 [Pedobacter westerhofensis]|uniref:Uncharacterized protein n=1 Tax=Pedobacter westerhofensis TaxID=425512 RepID=A0A521CQN8_9SPHI|nr:hypothetical protein [Pedobacter westerhofensis]SMO61718.1 hypothetical protein SAMN06265348_104122 [Pedobacter westerhofensis]